MAPNAPRFILCVFGTNNKFRAHEVYKRLQWTKRAVQSKGMKVTGLSADGDSRLVKFMVHNTVQKKNKFVCSQDSIHIGAKLKDKMLSPSLIMPMGRGHVVSRGHIFELIEKNNLRSEHQLCKSDINPKDKMNYKAVQRMCNPKVTELLRKHVVASEATAIYLDMMRDVVESFTEPGLKPLERIVKFWKWVYYVRFWRQWIENEDDYSLTCNFLTLNVQKCLEINGPALVQGIEVFRDSEEHNLFLPPLFSSQPCESSFRDYRAKSVTFSMLEMLNLQRGLDVVAESQHKLQSVIKLPRHHKAIKISEETFHVPTSLPEDFEIQAALHQALLEASELAVRMGLIKKSSRVNCPPCYVEPISDSDIMKDDEQHEEDNDIDSNIIQLDDKTSETVENLDACGDVEDVVEDLLVISSGNVGLKTFTDVNITETSPLVKVLDGQGNQVVIRKTTLCWLLNSGDSKISSDRLKRVAEEYTSLPSNLIHQNDLTNPCKEETVSIGDWCAFVEDGNVVIGRVLAFSYLTGTTIKNREFSALTAPTSAPKENARGVGCLCSWFKIRPNNILDPMSMDVHGYYDLKFYICAIPRPRLLMQRGLMKLKLSCTLTAIKKLMK